MQVGWDWASAAHDVTVMDDEGRIIDRWALEHSEVGIEGAIRRLASHGHAEGLPVAIETSSGLVVDRLMMAGHPVVPDPPQRVQRGSAPLGRLQSQVRPGRQLEAGRLPAHRCPSPPPAAAT